MLSGREEDGTAGATLGETQLLLKA